MMNIWAIKVGAGQSVGALLETFEGDADLYVRFGDCPTTSPG